MKLFEYTDEFGNTEVCTNAGTVIPADLLIKWEQMRLDSIERCKRLQKLHDELMSIVKENNENT